MIVLTATTDLIEVTVGAGTPVINVHASWVTQNGSVYTPGRSSVPTITGANTTTTIQAGPAAGQMSIKYVSVFNGGLAAINVQVKYTDGTNIEPLSNNISLGAGYTFLYMEGSDCWTVRDASGNIQTSIGPGRLLKTTVILTGTTTFTTTSSTSSIFARLVGAGGAGGGSPATTGENGSGGGSGGYAEWNTPVSPSTTYACAIAASAAGVSAANGNPGGNTTLTIGATTCTAFGGLGGLVSASIAVPVLGGAGAAISTNGTLNVAGEPGEPNTSVGTALDNRSGAGANSALGPGGAALLNASNAVGNSAAALGFGGGGGGASTTGTAHLGGASGPGVLIIQEYS